MNNFFCLATLLQEMSTILLLLIMDVFAWCIHWAACMDSICDLLSENRPFLQNSSLLCNEINRVKVCVLHKKFMHVSNVLKQSSNQ